MHAGQLFAIPAWLQSPHAHAAMPTQIPACSFIDSQWLHHCVSLRNTTSKLGRACTGTACAASGQRARLWRRAPTAKTPSSGPRELTWRAECRDTFVPLSGSRSERGASARVPILSCFLFPGLTCAALPGAATKLTVAAAQAGLEGRIACWKLCNDEFATTLEHLGVEIDVSLTYAEGMPRQEQACAPRCSDDCLCFTCLW